MLRLIGDAHGKHMGLVDICKDSEYSLCVGDIGFKYDYLKLRLDSNKNKLLGGNHDNYNKKPCEECLGENCKICEGRGFVYYEQPEHFLGDFGIWEVPNFGPIFYIRGAWSIDKDDRIPGHSWWEDEELSLEQMNKALNRYNEVKPNFVVTHTAPMVIVPMVPFRKIFGEKIHKPKTEQFLESLWDLHQPDYWVFGHWHCNWNKSVPHPKTGKETRFICLDELSYMDFPVVDK